MPCFGLVFFFLAGDLFNSFVHLEPVPTRKFHGDCSYLLSVLAKSTCHSPGSPQYCSCSFASSTRLPQQKARAGILNLGRGAGLWSDIALRTASVRPGNEKLITTFHSESSQRSFSGATSPLDMVG